MKVVAVSGFDHGGLVRRGQVIEVTVPTGTELIQRGLARSFWSLPATQGQDTGAGLSSAPARPARKSKRSQG